MKKRILALAVLCSVFVLLAGCEREKHRLDEEVRRLCAKDGGVKVYETVKFTPKLLDRFGRIWIPSIEDANESDEYYYVSEKVYLYGGKTSQIEEAVMWRDHDQVIRRSDGKILGESVYYARRGGDIPGPWHPSHFGCPELKDLGLIEKVFIRSNME